MLGLKAFSEEQVLQKVNLSRKVLKGQPLSELKPDLLVGGTAVGVGGPPVGGPENGVGINLCNQLLDTSESRSRLSGKQARDVPAHRGSGSYVEPFAYPAGTLARLEKVFAKRMFGTLAIEDPIAVVSPTCHGVFLRRRIQHVVDRAGVLEGKRSWHGIEIRRDLVSLIKN